jgi:hypothetical protein
LTGRPTLTFPKPVKFESYSRHQFQLSDHRPLLATVELQIPKTNGDRLHKFITMKNQKLDEMEEMRPLLTFRCADTLTQIVKSLTVRQGDNTQLVMSNESAVWARWQAELTIPTALAVKPKRGVLVPGKQEVLTITGLQITS